MNVAFLTLGCDKNTVDSEKYLADLVAHGATQVDDAADADVVIVNTCGFIDAAKQESIDAIVEAGKLKQTGGVQAVFAIGCMIERHKDELVDALPEIDCFLGTSETDRLVPELLERGLLTEDRYLTHPGTRLYSGESPHVRYLKISEGCDHTCAFCAIPLMRGKHRSFALDEIVREAQLLEVQGAREVSLVAQDLAHYGRDLRNGTGLPELLEALVRETSIPWFRNLYLYSAGITPRLLEVIAAHPRILRYLDMPMQHGHDATLARMRRPERAKTIREKVALYRSVVPELSIRTTCIVGFPGETDDEFDALCELLEELRLDRVGVFSYSPQEGTRAMALPDDVPESVKYERLERLTELQRSITADRYERWIGQTVRVLVDRAVDVNGLLEARAPWQADGIDGVTWVAGAETIAPAVTPGTFVDVVVDEVIDDYDFRARLVRVADRPATAPRASRALPLAPAGAAPTTMGAFGR
ncbi:MAG: 30S ribosomal protein S12 methylthiotransferase RimO [Gemmatimonadaceae bacterium]|nr:30S ribosomal protein S12 methylthiotransferase RimO [Gemmatimonadaceae bacterium]